MFFGKSVPVSSYALMYPPFPELKSSRELFKVHINLPDSPKDTRWHKQQRHWILVAVSINSSPTEESDMQTQGAKTINQPDTFNMPVFTYTSWFIPS